MLKAQLYDIKGQKKGDVDLPKELFDVTSKPSLVSLCVRVTLDNKRASSAHTKTKAEVRGGGVKPFRQKGNGRGRQGSIRNPHYVGGGIAFGPTNEKNYKRTLPKKMRNLALFSVLSDKVKDGRLAFIDFGKWSDLSTKKFKDLVGALPEFRKGKFVLSNSSNKANIIKSGRNLTNVSFTTYNRLPIDEMMGSDFIFFDEASLSDLIKLYSLEK